MAFVIDEHFIAITAIVTFVYQLSFFTVAVIFKFDKVTDFAGGTNFVVCALLTAILKGQWALRQTVLTLLIVIWGLRLSIFLLLRILSWGEDKRFDGTRNSIASTAIFWTYQAVWVWVCSLPVTMVNGTTRNPSISTLDIIGWIFWAVGLSIETIADQQKLNFKKNSLASTGRWCDVGVWKWSRHPNYFGEIFLWWGIFLSAASVLKGGQWSAICSPLFITGALLFLSGIPLLEKSADKKFGGRSDYEEYKNSTSPLFPLPPSLYSSLPSFVKLFFFLELPFYSSIKTSEGKAD